jgi:DNA repair exonuclease SbcCD nuclease subunit
VRLAHLADLHVGFRRYAVAAKGGMNQREADVQLAVSRAVDDVIACRPELVLLAGDVFHSVRPPNGAILFLFGQLQRVRAALPETRIVLVAGDHDTPRTTAAGVILPLFRALGIDLAIYEPERFALGEGVVVTAVPKAAAHRLPPPDKAARLNVLLLHGEVPGYGGPHPIGAVDPGALKAWDYVALGHYHVCAQVAPNAWYAGALEYTTTDPWYEVREEQKRGLPGKGWLLVDVDARVQFRPIGPARRHVDLEPLDCLGMAPADIDRLIAERLEAAKIDGAVARLRGAVARETKRALDHAAIRAFKARALSLNLELRETRTVAELDERRAEAFAKLDERLRVFLGDRELPADLNRDAFVELGMDYYRQAGEPAEAGKEEEAEA